MSSLTHINPFVQGGWDSEGPWPNDGSNSPATSSHSSGSTRGNDAVSQWFPAQSSYGVLPLAATPGVLPPGLLGAPVTFRFMACGNQTNIAVVGPGTRTIYRMKTNSTHTYVSIQTGIVAIINWAGTEPILELGGRSYRTSEYLRDSRDAQHTRIKVMIVGGHECCWTYDDKGFYVHPNGNLGQILGFVYNINGVEVKIVGNCLSTDVMMNIFLAVILMQGKMFVGLR